MKDILNQGQQKAKPSAVCYYNARILFKILEEFCLQITTLLVGKKG
jgi:hypothetical protein